MKKPGLLSFVTGAVKRAATDVDVQIVEQRSERSRVRVVVDQAGEACIKTPHAIPENEEPGKTTAD